HPDEVLAAADVSRRQGEIREERKMLAPQDVRRRVRPRETRGRRPQADQLERCYRRRGGLGGAKGAGTDRCDCTIFHPGPSCWYTAVHAPWIWCATPAVS